MRTGTLKSVNELIELGVVRSITIKGAAFSNPTHSTEVNVEKFGKKVFDIDQEGLPDSFYNDIITLPDFIPDRRFKVINLFNDIKKGDLIKATNKITGEKKFFEVDTTVIHEHTMSDHEEIVIATDSIINYDFNAWFFEKLK